MTEPHPPGGGDAVEGPAEQAPAHPVAAWHWQVPAQPYVPSQRPPTSAPFQAAAPPPPEWLRAPLPPGSAPPGSVPPGSVPPGAPVPPAPFAPPGPFVVAPPRRGRAALLIIPLLALLALVMVAGVVALHLPRTGTEPAAAEAPARSGSPGPSRTLSPGEVAAEAINGVLDAQGKALLAGDEAGFLDPADPADAGLRGELSRRFKALRSMRVQTWRAKLLNPPTLIDGVWHAATDVRHCMATTNCRADSIQISSRWKVDGTAVRMVGFDAAPEGERGPRPWEVADLRVSVGSRVMVVTTPKYANRLPALTTWADESALVADTFAKWDPAPERYVVYLAGTQEWQTWFGGKLPEWAGGYAFNLGGLHSEVVLNADALKLTSRTSVTDMLRHEFAHVTTLAGVRRGQPGTFWLTEGIADYIAVSGGSSTAQPASAARRYLRSGKWPGTVKLEDPADNASDEEVAGMYAVAYLAIDRLADRYGEDRMLDFFERTVRRGNFVETAAPQSFGTEWSVVEADLVQFLRALR